MGKVLDFFMEYNNSDWMGHDILEDITNRYEIKACLKMSEDKQVYLVTSKTNWKKYILKALSSHCHESLKEEFRLSRELSHPGIVAAVEYIEGGEYNYLIREYVEGYTVTELVEMTEEGHLQHEELLLITLRLCDILEYLHSQKPPIIHRDIKPDNIIVTKQKECKLIDFGISRRYQGKLDSDTFVMGTQFSAPPEQYGFAQTNERSDIYSIGVLMFYMATGNLDIRDLKQYPISGDIRRIIIKCTGFSPKDRYSSVKLLKNKLNSYPYLYRKRRFFYAGIILIASLVLTLGLFNLASKQSIAYEDKAVITSSIDPSLSSTVLTEKPRDITPELSLPETAESAAGGGEEKDMTVHATVNPTESTVVDISGLAFEVDEKQRSIPFEEEASKEELSAKEKKDAQTKNKRIAQQAGEEVQEISMEQENSDQITERAVTPALAKNNEIEYDFQSPLIEAAVREILDKSDKDKVTYGDLEQITSLFICGKQRYNRWEEHFVYGVNQYMIGSQYTDTQLFTVNGEVTSLEDISHMVNLEMLALYNQKISDLAPLKDLHYLSYLGLGSNNISELTHLTSIKSLNYIDLSGNPIMNDELKHLRELPYLWGLDLGATKVTSLYEIKELKLYFLSLFECKMGDCIGLDEIATLDNLILTGVNNAITDRAIDRVSKLTNLKILKIFGSDRIDLSKLSTLKSLYLLDLCGMWNNSNLGDLSNPKLTQLYLVYCQVLDLTGIEKLTCLEQIHLRDSKCSDYTPLLGVKTLKTVYCNQEQQKIIKEQLGEVPFEVLIE